MNLNLCIDFVFIVHRKGAPTTPLVNIATTRLVLIELSKKIMVQTMGQNLHYLHENAENKKLKKMFNEDPPPPPKKKKH